MIEAENGKDKGLIMYESHSRIIPNAPSISPIYRVIKYKAFTKLQ